MSFIKMRDAVEKQINKMTKQDIILKVSIDRDIIWDTYLQSFPEGTNELYRERTEHDCNCCKNFIRDVGSMVAIIDGKVVTVWDIEVDDHYQIVADKMAELVRKSPIKSPFRHQQSKIGLLSNVDSDLVKHDHFCAVLPSKLVDKDSGSYIGLCLSNYSVLKRSLEEISNEAVDIVKDLISQNALYRGDEHKRTVETLSALKSSYGKLETSKEGELFLWRHSLKLGAASKIRNTVIGTLLTDITEGVDLEKAVKSFETKVAPQNYKRTTALITQGMIDKAQEKIEDLGLEDALYRRYAVEDDVTINNVLFANRDTRKKMKGSAFDGLKPTSTKGTPNLDGIQEMVIDKFISDVLPNAETLELFLENKQESNLMSVIAPVQEDSGSILKWNNNFSWSYNGDVTDGIKERVKAAGGNVTGELRFSLSWFNYDDLDIYVTEPQSSRIYFSNKRSSLTKGCLDIDMNAGSGKSRSAVENVVWNKESDLVNGKYKVVVHNYSKRENVDVGFEIQMEHKGSVENFSYEKAVNDNEHVTVTEFTYSKINGITFDHRLKGSKTSKEIWGVNTQQFQKVKMVMLSPNHWDDQEIGNKHWFFILDNCNNPDKSRGFYNEFLRNDLTEHRKVFETLGSKMKTEKSENQLSGIGFSSTKEDSFIVKVGGSFNRTLKIKI